MAPLDLVSALVSDELLRRQDRLLARRIKQAGFRDAEQDPRQLRLRLQPQDEPRASSSTSPPAHFVAQHEDALFLGPPGTGKSHLAQAIGHAAIQQGYTRRSTARPTCCSRSSPTRPSTARARSTSPSSPPCRCSSSTTSACASCPHTAAEDLLELVMRRYERASTLLTSNRPVDDWGKLLGDIAAVTAMLDRLLHHAHVLKCGPRSWRTKLQTDIAKQEATR